MSTYNIVSMNNITTAQTKIDENVALGFVPVDGFTVNNGYAEGLTMAVTGDTSVESVKIVTGSSVSVLTTNVSDLIAQGYLPQGGFSYANGTFAYIQLMVKRSATPVTDNSIGEQLHSVYTAKDARDILGVTTNNIEVNFKD